MSTSQKIVFRNDSGKDILLYVEPRGDEYKIKAGDEITIQALGGEPHHYIEFFYDRDDVVTIGWSGDEVQLLRKGVQLTPWE